MGNPSSNLLTYEGMEYYNAKMLESIKALLNTGEIVPPGGIIMYSGSVESIPIGWYLCDGQNGTPDLRDRFVIGASDTVASGNTGGASSITLGVEHLPPHTHTLSGVNIDDNGEGGSLFNGGEAQISAGNAATTGETGGGEAISILPPYYALAFIMKAPKEN